MDMRELIKYSFLAKIRDLSLVFWPLVFPLVLTTAMYISIGQMEESDFETIPAAIVTQSTGEEDVFQEYLETVGDEQEALVSVRPMVEEEAVTALENGDVEGIFYSGEEPSLTVGGSGLAQSILQMILESYTEGKQTLEDVSGLHPEGMEAAIRQMSDYGSVTEDVSLGGRTTNTTAQFFYALIGMACLYGCFIGYQSAMDLQANLSDLAARRCVSPVHRMQWILSETAVSFGLHFFNMIVLLAYMKYILRLQFESSYAQMLPVVIIGSMIGVTMGMFITSIGKMGEGVKIGIMISVSMVMSFLAGLMNADIKNMIDRNVPFLNRINPAALISDALYCLNVYDAPARYMQDILILLVMCVLLLAGTFLIVRRERYGSI